MAESMTQHEPGSGSREQTGSAGSRREELEAAFDDAVTFSVPDALPLFDFDDASNLLGVGMRPSHVVLRNVPSTQGKAASLFDERKWAGVRWWSFHRPVWTSVMLWATPAGAAPARLESVDALTLSTPAVVDAAWALARPLP